MGSRDKIIALCISVAASLLLAPAALAADTATVHGVLSDNAVIAKPLVNGTVTIGGVAAAVSGQSYSASGVPVGVQTLVISAPRHLPLTQLVTLLPGDNTIDVALSLTAKESYLRYYAAYNHKRFGVAWQMVHPDARSHLRVWGHWLTYRTYRWDMVSWNLPFVSMRIKAVKTEATWRPRARARLPHPVYYDIVHIDRLIRYKFPDAVARDLDAVGLIFKDDCYIHWQLIDGRWYTIFDSIWCDR